MKTSRMKLPDSANVLILLPEALWHWAKQIVTHPFAEAVLDASMKDWVHFNPIMGSEWCPSKGPWYYSESWHETLFDLFYRGGGDIILGDWVQNNPPPSTDENTTEYANWEQLLCDEQGRLTDFCNPQPSEPNWYRCYGACHYLRGWNAVIGELLFPQLKWYIVAGEEHSTSIGIKGTGKRKQGYVFDILWGHETTVEGLYAALGSYEIIESDMQELASLKHHC